MNFVKIDKIDINLTVDSIFCYLGNNSCFCPFQALALRPGDGGGIARRSGEILFPSLFPSLIWHLLFLSARALAKFMSFDQTFEA